MAQGALQEEANSWSRLYDDTAYLLQRAVLGYCCHVSGYRGRAPRIRRLSYSNQEPLYIGTSAHSTRDRANRHQSRKDPMKSTRGRKGRYNAIGA